MPRVPVVAPSSPALVHYEKGMAALQKGDWTTAQKKFEAVAALQEAETVLVDRAKLYVDFCRRKAEQQQKIQTRRSDDELYASAVFEKNRGELSASLDIVRRLLRKGDDEKIHHLAAAIHAVRGEGDEALDHLKRALKKNPALIFQVRNDPDFATVRETPIYRKLEDAARRG